ncbi:hypothetical protein [Yersinia mollaretii]|uniref:hypothetical protein n=1 Tax=Yersinia mollaretii TaxID=33060 RepID=UPI0005DA89AC|nr:hypothetical protein [Yersinia mollaretii]PJE89046.1 hypothetical protein CU280_05235 [Yersinia mollaretii]CQD40671.1 Uncharacterised protein [Yersinia mollaretii]CQH17026.1 Uncharacterised protein [Yersinia mollaretii]
MTQQEIASTFALFNKIQYVGTAPNRAVALERYQDNFELLKEWRVLYADNTKEGPFRLRRQYFGQTGFVSTVFRGRSIWIIDSDVIANQGTLPFKIGMGTHLDTNSASYIRALAYKPQPAPSLYNVCDALSDTFSIGEMSDFNPYLYLWEVQSNRSQHSIKRIRETISAIAAIKLIKAPLTIDWRQKYQEVYRLVAEKEADIFLAKFYADIDLGHGDGIESLVDMMEIILLKTKIIEHSSNRSAQNKLEELLIAMDSQMSTFMFRELVICADILFKSKKTQLSEKINSLQNQKKPLALIRNCARDMSMIRMLDQMTNTYTDNNGSSFYIGNLITFDKDVRDIIEITELNAIALHQNSSATFPIYNTEIQNWLSKQLGEKRLERLSFLFSFKAFASRAKNRSHSSIKEQLIEDRAQLLSLLVIK